ncbi:hypothetical protein [Billgrantia endophytica]|uniref:Uncharacterized protein n=1 Tax=Billgrantia endophytica TaxID=2033802 RepID=A0A2N7TUB9_9GAMM|nr:hypothetical protein [Halomonas endophytica]PMR71792.1 hypothetical protein C1H69_22935 [Halomonas endophytica]
MEYEVDITEPKKFEFDINIHFNIDGNPHTIRIEDVLGGYPWKNYQEIDTCAVVDLASYGHLLGFTRNPFKVVISVLEKDKENYDFSSLRSETLIDSEYSYITLNKLKGKLQGDDKELEIFKLLRSVLQVGFSFLEQHIEKKRVEEQFNKQENLK